jgi:glycosyltransferase involved in cell wall biosynthesis
MTKILYIASRLPAVSATFIDREIRVLAAAGYTIKTVSRASPLKGEVSDETLDYYRGTLYLDQASIFSQLYAQLYVLASKPLDWFKNIRLILNERETRNLHDRFRLIKHFIEAGYVYVKIRDEGISQIHAHFLNAPTSIALFLSHYINIPYSFTMHASNIFIDPLMLGTKLHLCKKAVTISEYNKTYLLNKYGKYLSEKLVVIHCGIDPETFTPGHGEKSECPVVLAVGRLVAMKGFHYLLEACRKLKDKGISFTCLIVGDGEEKDRLINKASALGVEDVVTFLGSQQQARVYELLRKASIFVLPSIITDQGQRDGIPVSIMEAMAMELPVVSTKIVGIPELVEDGKEGLLVEQKDSAGLALALEHLIKNAHVRIEMGRLARLKVMREFNIAHIPSKFESILN